MYRFALRIPGRGGWALETRYSWPEIVTFRLHLLVEDVDTHFCVPLILEQRLRTSVYGLIILLEHEIATEINAPLLEHSEMIAILRKEFGVKVDRAEGRYVRVECSPDLLKKNSFREIAEVMGRLIEEFDHYLNRPSTLSSSFYKYPRELATKSDLKSVLWSARVYRGFFLSCAVVFFIFGFFSIYLGWSSGAS